MDNNLQKKDEFSLILNQIKSSKEKVFQQANTILIELYWNIGGFISEKVKNASWGKSVVKELSKFITTKEPNVRGFSARNIWRMKQFYETYSDSLKLATVGRILENEKVLSVMAELEKTKLATVWRVLENEKVSTVWTLLENNYNLLINKYLSWTHHRRMIRAVQC